VSPGLGAKTVPMDTASARIPTATRLILLLAGTPILLIGLWILIDPVGFQAGAGITVGTDPSDLNESRGAAGALVTAGALTAVGAFRSRLTFAAALAGATVHVGYGSARFLSLFLDGTPDIILILAVSAELPLGAACLLAAYRLTRTSARDQGPAFQPVH
jgi:hypothetical protein